jgi:hypothetical protein
MTEQIIKSLPSRLKNTDILNDDIKTVDYCYASSHDYCKHILSLLTHYIDQEKVDIPEKLIERYIKVICNSIECWSLNYDINITRAMYIFENCDLTDNIINQIINLQNAEVFTIFINNYKITDDILDKILDKNNFYNITYDFIKNNTNYNYTNKLINCIIKNNDIDTLNKMIDNKMQISNEQFIKIIALQSTSLDIIKKCIINGAKIEKNTLSLVINEYLTNKHYEAGNYYYYHSNNTPQKYENIFIFLFENGSTDITWTDLKQIKYYVGTNEFNNILNNFIDNDMKLTTEDFVDICNSKIKINYIKKINHFFKDDNVVNAIYTNNLKYPVEIKYTYEMLKSEVIKNNLIKVKEIIKSITPTQELLELACKTQSLTMIKYLHEVCALKFNEKCILNHSQYVRHSTLLDYLRMKYNEI